MYPFAQLGQDTAQAVGGHPSHDRRMGGLHTFKQLGGGEAKHFLRIVLFCSKAKAKAEHLFFGYMLVDRALCCCIVCSSSLLNQLRSPDRSSVLSWAYNCLCSTDVVQSMACFRLTQRKRREPVRSTSKSSRLLVPMNEAIRGSDEALCL